MHLGGALFESRLDNPAEEFLAQIMQNLILSRY